MQTMKRRDHPSGKGKKHFYDTTLFLCMERDQRTFGTLEVMEEMKVKRRR
jgi:hypothetical protein